GSFQNSRFVMAGIATEVEIAQVFVDRCVLALNAGELTAEEAAMAQWWCTDLQKRVVDRALQLHGGYGYMLEYPIARAYADARITTIYGGTTEIMKEIIGRSLGLLPQGSAGGGAVEHAGLLLVDQGGRGPRGHDGREAVDDRHLAVQPLVDASR